MSRTSIPKLTSADFERVEASAEYFDTHGLTDYLEHTPFDDARRISEGYQLLMISPDLWGRLAMHAEARGVSVETLAYLWLEERAAA